MTNESSEQREPQGRPVLLVGSVPLADEEAVFSMAGDVLGDRLASVPDGETGKRSNWVFWQRDAMLAAGFLQEESIEAVLGSATRREVFGVRGDLGTDASFGPLGYARVAKQSYEQFKVLREAGRVARSTRFQVSLPTPAAPMTIFIKPSDISRVAPLYARAMREEIADLCRAIPPEDLSIQWDVALEFAALEGIQPGVRVSPEEVANRLAMLGSWVPEGVGLGYHYCYGDVGHKHFKEPESTALMVKVANLMFDAAMRSVDYIHMPVPRSRNDDAYFAPLRDLRLPSGCRLYLGLVHRTDGLEGAKARLNAAERFVPAFGVATECGWGRRPPETIPEVMQLTAEVADL